MQELLEQFSDIIKATNIEKYDKNFAWHRIIV
jgi:hypothetical protein